MSTCISRHGEYGEHVPLATTGPARERFVCSRCHVLDEYALLDEVDRLSHWKAEALPVLDGLQELGRALSLPPGTRIAGTQALEAVQALTAGNERIIAARLAAQREEIANLLQSMAGPWGAEAMWLTTGNKIATLTADLVREARP